MSFVSELSHRPKSHLKNRTQDRRETPTNFSVLLCRCEKLPWWEVWPEDEEWDDWEDDEEFEIDPADVWEAWEIFIVTH